MDNLRETPHPFAMLMDNLISDEEIQALPDDLPTRYLGLIRLVRPRFLKRIDSMTGQTGSKPRSLAYWHEFQTAMIGYAKGWDIPAIAHCSTPEVHAYSQSDADKFYATLTQYEGEQRAIADQLARQSLVSIDTKTKAKMLTQVATLREQIDLAGLTIRRARRLHSLLDEFEIELNKGRSSWRIIIGNATMVVALFADFGGATETVTKFPQWVSEQIIEAQDDEAADRPQTLLTSETRRALTDQSQPVPKIAPSD